MCCKPPTAPPPQEHALEDVCLVGTPDEVRQRMERYAAAGVTRFELRVAPGDMPLELVERTVRLVGEKVMPHLG